MSSDVRDLLARRATESFVGRTVELERLLSALTGPEPLVMYVHGLGGIGKSALLEAFLAKARAKGVVLLRLDCQVIEPTERGFLAAIADTIGGPVCSVDRMARRLARLGRLVVLALDTYEVFRLMDAWIRQTFVPALASHVRLILVGRDPPVPEWRISSAWQGLFRSLALGPLSRDDAACLLEALGVDAERATRINRFARGHPLALKLAASTLRERPNVDIEDAAFPGVLDALTRSYLSDVCDPVVRDVVNASSVVRRTTLPLLKAMLPDTDARWAFEQLRALPFVEVRRDGLFVHDSVRYAIAATYHAADPSGYLSCRRAAWQHLRGQARTAGGVDLWRYTADILYLIENPVVREAFFPSSGETAIHAVEPARAEDWGTIQDITRQHDGAAAAKVIEIWWRRVPACFRVVRATDSVVGFYCMADTQCVSSALAREDPIARQWTEWLQAEPVRPGQRVLLLRRWLSAEHGEAPSPVQAACWLDIKRMYMELRPNLRRIILALRDLQPYAAAAQQLCFQHVPVMAAPLDGTMYESAMLDFGPDSVDGWLQRLVAAELGMEQTAVVDVEAREVRVGERRISLTRREWLVFDYLWRHEGRIVSRETLLENLWAPDYEWESNVVEVAVRSVRRKLGESCRMIETVRGRGYRLHRA